MGNEISEDQIEILQEFIQESRDMIEQLEPSIIELGNSCPGGNCWEILDCTNQECPRHSQTITAPCWLDTGYIGDGDGSCCHAENAQECKDCKVFLLTNGDKEMVNAIFRLFHSMKGSAGFLELDHISHVAHAAENLLDLIRSGKIRMHPKHVDMLCRSCDFSKEALDCVESNYTDDAMAEQAGQMAQTLAAAVEEALADASCTDAAEESDSAQPSPAEPSAPEPTEPGSAQSDEKPQFPDMAEIDMSALLTPELITKYVQEAEDLIQTIEGGLLARAEGGVDSDHIADTFRNIHSLKGNCGFLGFSDLEQLSHRMETVLELAKEQRLAEEKDAAEHLLSLVDLLEDAVTDIAQGGKGRIDDLNKHLETLQRYIDAPAPAPPPQTPAIAPSEPASSIKEKPAPQSKPQAPPKSVKPPKSVSKQRQDIRVDLSKLDSLVNLIGELVIAENMLVHNPDIAGLELENFNKASQQMGKIVRELQELAMTIRMIPVSGLFKRMIRLVHDLAIKSGKKVDFKLSGEETELDKTVIETISDPLVHLIRNAIDHGLESGDVRLENGKSESGSLRLSARHEEGEVLISLEDDGRGLNKDKILQKAISKGLAQEGQELTDKEIYDLIFQPGFSTADTITDVSGRGVGMDVVRQNLESIKGRIVVHSTPGEGTRFDLYIPLTLGIIDGMMVRVQETRCIVPTRAIREAFRPQTDALTETPDGQQLVRVRGKFYPIISLHQVLQKQQAPPKLEDAILILVEYQNAGVCLMADEILGQQQTVIKGLSDYLGNVRGISGCTILGDGEVCLILDIGTLVEMKKQSQG